MFTYLVQQDKFFLLRWADYLPPMPCYNLCSLGEIFEGPHFQGQKWKCIFKVTAQKCLAIKNSDTWTDSSSRNNIWSSFSSTDLNIECCFSCFNCQTIEDQFLICFFLGKESPFFLVFKFYMRQQKINVWIFLYRQRIKSSVSYRPISRQQKINLWLFPLQEKNQIICELPTHIEAHSWSQPDAAGRRWTNSACCTRLEPIVVFSFLFYTLLLPSSTTIVEILSLSLIYILLGL